MIQNQNLETIMSTMRDKCSFVSIDRCSHPLCHRFFLFEEYSNQPGRALDYYNDGRITFCSCLCLGCNCEKNADRAIGWWCKEHLPKDCIINNSTTSFNFICGKCSRHCI